MTKGTSETLTVTGTPAEALEGQTHYMEGVLIKML